MKSIPEDQALYRRWSYDPHADEAYIDQDNGLDQNGYAYRIDGGWRVFDQDHDSVDDLYTVRRVMDALRNKNDGQVVHKDFNFSKLHYGQPMPRKGK
jgi:hypothetical protein